MYSSSKFSRVPSELERGGGGREGEGGREGGEEGMSNGNGTVIGCFVSL